MVAHSCGIHICTWSDKKVLEFSVKNCDSAMRDTSKSELIPLLILGEDIDNPFVTSPLDMQ
ncbi:hypothetical protein BOW51_01945 [Solemya velesiana gill symbiont]|uniref:Uncharacterized protein n=1 Tax=Solemya velesiana gill symbiont TaxID=1918948 RepID=A0A1T2KXD0_9GAMM|nr:hypothetical protein BOW51_01945 [Solemya velesiana gill symbiont]